MSEMKIPEDSSSIDKTYQSPTPPSNEQPEKTSFTAPVKDSLEAFTLTDLPSIQQQSDAPQLQTPTTRSDSMLAYFRTINAATLALRHQLQASDLVDQSSRRHASQAAAAQSQALLELYKQRNEAIAQLQTEAKQALDELQKQLDRMKIETEQQQKRVDQINAGNAEEKAQHQKLSQAYDEYIKQLESIGAVDQGNGNYSIPEGAEEQFNALTQEYQHKVDSFNEYWKARQAQINQYNSATIAYNQSTTANNKYINDLINKYNLGDFLKDNGYAIPEQKGANLRDLSGYQNQIITPSPISSTPALVSTYPLPSYVQSIGTNGPPKLGSLDSFIPVDGQKLYEGIYRNLYDSRMPPLDQKIQANYLFWSFWHMQSLFDHVYDTVPDPLLNTKLLALRLLPLSFIESTMPIKPSENVGASGIAMQAIGLSHTHLEDILGRAMLKQALASFNLKLLEEKDALAKEQKIDQLTDQLLFLSIGLLGNQSLQALFPGVSLLGPSLDSLPKDSPAFAILFAVSFANRIQEDAKQGITAETLKTFLKSDPELSHLPEEDQTKLAAILNLGQLLVAAKLLETNLGLQGLLAQILPAFASSLDSTTILSQAIQEGKQDLAHLQTRLNDHFIQQGYSQDKAQFLAQVGTELAEQGLLTPTSTSVNYPQAIHHPLLVNSVKAALVLANYPLEKADHIARESIDHTLVEAPFRSTKQFRTSLNSHLQDLGVPEKNSTEIALQAVLIPPQEKALALSPSTDKRTASTETPLSSPQLSPAQLIAILEKRSLQLLVPQLGTQAAKQVTEEIAKTLFGTANPDSRDIGNVKSPYSLVNVIKDQLHHLHAEQNQAWTNAVSDAFKETIKTMEDFYAFSLKLMDPAYLFVYSAHAGIIYPEHVKNKPRDILI